MKEKKKFLFSNTIVLKLIALLIVWYLPCMAFSQYNDHRNRQVDSLEQVLATHPPTGKELRSIYYELMWGYQEINTEKYNEEEIDCSYAATYGTISNFYNIQGKYQETTAYYQKALKTFEKYGKYQNQANAYNYIGEIYLSMNNYEQAEINFTNTAVALIINMN